MFTPGASKQAKGQEVKATATEVCPEDSEETTDWADSGDTVLGTTLNNSYAVGRLIGQGGMGRVYEAVHTRISKKRFAIKVLRQELTADPDVLRRFQREAEIAACVSHQNVVGVYDVDRTKEGLPYIVYEYLDGMELASYLKSVGRLDSARAIFICHKVCEALEAAHKGGVIHRDLKPQNIFLVGDFENGVPDQPMLKVLDFGLSRFLNASNTLTRTGVVMGTPSYMSPEQARGGPTDHRTDIYGVGAILYTLLTGQPPFSADTPQMTVLAVLEGNPPRPRSIEPTIPQYLELVVQRAMAKDPAHRYPDVTALKHAIDPAGDALSATDIRMVPRGVLDSNDEEAAAQTARPRLVLMIGLAIVLCTSLLSIALVAIGTLTGWLTFRPVEITLLLLGALGTSVTPGIILVARIRRVIWDNTPRVLDTLTHLSTTIIAGLLGYGVASLLVRFADAVVARFTDTTLLGHAQGSAWPGWDLFFPAIGALGAGATWLRRVLVPNRAARWKRLVVGPVVFLSALLIAGVVVLGGLWWRAATNVSAPAKVSPAPTEKEPETTPSPVARTTSMNRGSPEKTSDRASDDELAAAVVTGQEGLVDLAKAYPGDPDVLQRLMFVHASQSTGHVDAMAVAKQLLTIDPSRSNDLSVRLLISKVARSSSKASDAAMELLAGHMGTVGPDALYDLMLSKSGAAVKAHKLLSEPAVQEQFSPALKIAYALRTAESCEARLPLLERAAALGDERSILVLSPLTQGTKRGCGRWKRNRCPAACAKEAKQYLDTIEKITKRERGTL